MKPAPLVSVVTPVYNGGRYLAECIESVLAQTYTRWEYVIVNNASKDATGDIARKYAAADPRIRVVDNPECLPMFQNWNHAMRQMSPESAYCKVVHADDCLMPDCLAKMVGLAERHARVGIVSSHHKDGNEVAGLGLAPTQEVFPGIEVCRATLRGEYSVFGSPSTVLIRSDLVRARPDFYDASFFHADKAVCLALLQHCDLGFVHEVLTYTRLHEESQSVTFGERFETKILEHVLMVHAFGPSCMPPEEYQPLWLRVEFGYYRYMMRQLFAFRGREFFNHHLRQLRTHGIPLCRTRIVRAGAMELAACLLRPGESIEKLRKRFAMNAMRQQSNARA
jgi:glycosyltransferase involved in cell wall biosynthesis